MRILRFNESFSNQIFYKIVSKEIFDNKIKDSRDFKIGYVINHRDLDGWILPNDLFGSLLQALIYFPSRRGMDMYLLKISLPQGDHKIKIRNVDMMLRNLTKYKASKVDITSDEDRMNFNYPIIESIIDEVIDINDIEIVNLFVADKLLSVNKIDPNDLKMYIFGEKSLSEIKTIGKMNFFKLISKYTMMKLKSIFGF